MSYNLNIFKTNYEEKGIRVRHRELWMGHRY